DRMARLRDGDDRASRRRHDHAVDGIHGEAGTQQAAGEHRVGDLVHRQQGAAHGGGDLFCGRGLLLLAIQSEHGWFLSDVVSARSAYLQPAGSLGVDQSWWPMISLMWLL